jgi:hypothetical protein
MSRNLVEHILWHVPVEFSEFKDSGFLQLMTAVLII